MRVEFTYTSISLLTTLRTTLLVHTPRTTLLIHTLRTHSLTTPTHTLRVHHDEMLYEARHAGSTLERGLLDALYIA